MSFYDYSFLFAFLPLILAVYYLIPQKFRNAWFLAASLIFYFFADMNFLPVLVTAALVNHLLGSFLDKARRPAPRKALLAAGIVFNLGLLCSFKYLGFFAETLRLLPPFSQFFVSRSALPIGISFYVFTSMSYLVDLYKNQVRPANSLTDFSAFLTMFPHIISGPIVRFREIRDQFQNRIFDPRKINAGIALFIMGLAKKILLADTAGYFCDPVFALPHPGFFPAWVASFLFSAQIYFDFSGYTDMAIGIALLLGFEYPQNFNSPYKAATINEFWQRWHMTFYRWLRDYLYISLGGNRKGTARTYFNLMVTMLLGGLWHGASWNFVIWGAFHGVLLSLERQFGLRSAPQGKLARVVRTGFTFTIFTFGLGVFFKCRDMAHSLRWAKSLLIMDGLGITMSWELVAALAVCMAVIFGFKNSWAQKNNTKPYWIAFLVACLVLSLAVAYTKGGMPFLYARF